MITRGTQRLEKKDDALDSIFYVHVIIFLFQEIKLNKKKGYSYVRLFFFN
jgi:hypothetical protein